MTATDMNRLLSEARFNRALIWVVMASMTHDNVWFKGAYLVLAVLNMAKSFKAYVGVDA